MTHRFSNTDTSVMCSLLQLIQGKVEKKQMLINICRKTKLLETKPASTYYVTNFMENIFIKLEKYTLFTAS